MDRVKITDINHRLPMKEEIERYRHYDIVSHNL